MDEERKVGIGLPMFGKLLFSPDEATGSGGNDPLEKVSTPETETANSEIPAPVTSGEPKNWEKEHQTYLAGEPKRIEEAEQKALQKWAMSSPQRYKDVTGMEPPPGMFTDAKPEAKPGETPEEDRPMTRKEYDLEMKRRDQAQADQRRAEAIKFAAFDEFDKHPDVFDPSKNPLAEWATQAAGNEIRLTAQQGRNPDIAKIVADTAKKYRDFAAKQQTQMVNGKVETANKVPPPSGKGAVPGKAPEGKLKLGKGPGTYAQKLEDELRAALKGGSRDDR